MEDLALITGGKFFSESMSAVLESVQGQDLGTARKVLITRESCVIYDGAGKEETVKAHLDSLYEQYNTLEDKADKDKIKERIAKLTAGVVVIKVGSFNATDMKEKKFRYEDAISATRSALQEGILPGGGTSLLRASLNLGSKFKPQSDVESMARTCVINALRTPVSLIAENAGFSGREVVGNLLRRNTRTATAIGFNAANGKYGVMRQMGIVDPTKVERLALQNAANIAGMFLTTEAVITDEPGSEPPPRPGMG
jgi:chaperonin GroEL